MKRDKSAEFTCPTVMPWVEIRTALNSVACYDSHSHDEVSFGIINCGSAKYRNQRNQHLIGQGDVVTINPGDVHSCNPDKGKWSYSMLFVDALKLGDVQREIRVHTQDYLSFNNDLEKSPLIQQRYLALYDTLSTGTDSLNSESLMFDFVEVILGANDVDGYRTPNAQENVARVRDKLLDEMHASHSLEDLAHEAGLSQYKLLRTFKKHYGLPPHAYLLDEKIKRSKLMLKNGSKVIDVANELGFSDQAHFQRHFKKKLAVTPKYYQSHFIP